MGHALVPFHQWGVASHQNSGWDFVSFKRQRKLARNFFYIISVRVLQPKIILFHDMDNSTPIIRFMVGKINATLTLLLGGTEMFLVQDQEYGHLLSLEFWPQIFVPVMSRPSSEYLMTCNSQLLFHKSLIVSIILNQVTITFSF